MKTMIQVQAEAIEAILCAKTQGKRACMSGMTLLDKSPRVLRGIRHTMELELSKLGFTTTDVQWNDVKDMAALEAESE